MRTQVGVVAMALVLGACGANSADADDLSPAALAGRSVARGNGCAACHGSNGQGGVGPPFVGLFGSERPIEGSDVPVVADREYLVESIVEPSAKVVEGYNLPMPRVELSDREIDDLIAYIEALAEDAP